MGYDDYEPVEFHVYDEPEEEKPRWTPGRILFVLITLLVIVTFLAYVFSPFLIRISRQQPRPTPITEEYDQTRRYELPVDFST